MSSKKSSRNLTSLLQSSISIITANPVILIPFITIAFIQLIVLEILYFIPRFPLAAFFNPIVSTLWGEKFIHYPDNFIILPKLFQNIQVFIYIFVTSFLIAVSVAIISGINNGRKMSFLTSCRETIGQYIHIFTGALISFCVFLGLYKLYGLLMARALNISSIDGIFFIIKKVILDGAPYVNLLIGAFVTTIFAFVFPIIVIEKKKVFAALWLNVKYLWGSFRFIFMVVLILTLFYLPVLILRSNIGSFAQSTFPEVRVLALVLGVFVTMFIDAAVYTSVTTFYLLQKERS